jgi:hypothetical protein
MTNWASSAKTVRGARRILAECQRNHDYAARADVPPWLRNVCAGRVRDAGERLRALQTSDAGH